MVKYLWIALALILGIGFVFQILSRPKKAYVEVGGKKVEVEIADNDSKRAVGLMGRKQLDKDSGMFFIFPNEKIHTFWMAGTFIPLDIIWINSNLEIVYISENTPPCTESVKSACSIYKPTEKAKYVLEVNSGWVKENNVSIGDTIKIHKLGDSTL